MKVLIVCSGNAPGFNFEIHQAFISDQVKAIQKGYPEIEFGFFFIKGKGMKGYLRHVKLLKATLRREKYDMIHAHFSLSALVANLQFKVPVVTTFHGSDINNSKTRALSALVELLSKKTIYVSRTLLNKAWLTSSSKSEVIPCGVDLDVFKPGDRIAIRLSKAFTEDVLYILFSSAFNNPVKNYALLEKAVALLTDMKIKVLELWDYTREEVAELMNAADLCVMTSFTEGSPQFIKEAMAINCPIVSTDVGDVREVLSDTYNCSITTYDPRALAGHIRAALQYGGRTNGREKISYLDNKIIAEKIKSIYTSIEKD